VLLEGLGVAGEGLQAVVVLDFVVAAVTGLDLVRDVPEELGAHERVFLLSSVISA
jgi:hypothetical protein